MRTSSSRSPALASLLALGSGCIEAALPGADLSLAEPIGARRCETPCHLASFGDAAWLDGLEGRVSSSTGRACAVPSREDLAWAFVPTAGTRLLPVGESEGSASLVRALPCRPAAAGEPCEPESPGPDMVLFLVALEEEDQTACDLLRSSDLEAR